MLRCSRRTVSMLWLKTSGRAASTVRSASSSTPRKSGVEHLDARLRQLGLDRPDRRREVAGAAVGDVVAVDRGDDDVLELHLRRSLADAERLECVGRILRLAGVDVAVAAGAGARVAENLEGRRAAPPALGDVRAAGLLADGVQREAVQKLLDVEVAAVGARRADFHPLGPAGPFGDGKRGLHRVESRCGAGGRVERRRLCVSETQAILVPRNEAVLRAREPPCVSETQSRPAHLLLFAEPRHLWADRA